MRWILSILFVCFSLTAHEPITQKKVIFVTVPKSGTNLLTKAVKLISGLKPKWIGSSGKTPGSGLSERLLSSDTKLYVTHLFPTADEIRSLPTEKFTKVLLIRDPRDVMVSFLYHITEKGRWPFAPSSHSNDLKKLPFDEQITAALQFPPLGPNHSIPYAATWVKDPTIVVIRFEDLIGSRGGGSDTAQSNTLRTLGRTMGIELSQGEINSIANDLFGGTWTFRQGQIGGWKTAYNAKNKALFKEVLGQATIDLGYASDFRW